MFYSQNWTLTQQLVVEDPEFLKIAIKMSELENVHMGIQMTPKKDK